MAFHRFIRAPSRGEPIVVYGDGEQTRDFTFISDALDANLLSLKEDVAGEVFNIGGGSRISIKEVHPDSWRGSWDAPYRVEYQARSKGR